MTAATGARQQNNDLVWNFANFQQKELAKDFIMRFESRLCVYSPSVEQVYTNYSINFPTGDHGKMVVLPNPYAFHDTFHNIPGESIRDSGLFIVPGSLIGKHGLFVIAKFKNQTVKPVPLPIRHALKKMVKSGDEDDPFLPILIKGDLREMNTETPCLHLHRIRLPDMSRRSEFEKKSIKNAIFDKLSDLYRDAEQLADGL